MHLTVTECLTLFQGDVSHLFQENRWKQQRNANFMSYSKLLLITHDILHRVSNCCCILHPATMLSYYHIRLQLNILNDFFCQLFFCSSLPRCFTHTFNICIPQRSIQFVQFYEIIWKQHWHQKSKNKNKKFLPLTVLKLCCSSTLNLYM